MKRLTWFLVVPAALAVLWGLDVISRAALLFLQQSLLVKRFAAEVGASDPRTMFVLGEAWFVGLLGAFTFYLGVFLGFIGRESREKTLQHFGYGAGGLALVALFCVSGGIVAAVFQAAQPGTFAPIQAFVLGATWPSVVMRIMSGDGGNLMPGARLTDEPPASIPAPGGRSATSAEVTI